MPWVHIAPQPKRKHACRLPGITSKPLYSIWRCRRCGKKWEIDDDRVNPGRTTWRDLKETN